MYKRTVGTEYPELLRDLETIIGLDGVYPSLMKHWSSYESEVLGLLTASLPIAIDFIQGNLILVLQEAKRLVETEDQELLAPPAV